MDACELKLKVFYKKIYICYQIEYIKDMADLEVRDSIYEASKTGLDALCQLLQQSNKSVDTKDPRVSDIYIFYLFI